jgi:homoserine acetyltransferase
MSDPNWKDGFYYDGPQPSLGMKLAREIATITYRSGPEWEQRFGRKRISSTASPSFEPDFAIEGYLDHQGERFSTGSYDPNSLLYISKAMDMFDMSHPIPQDPNASVDPNVSTQGEMDERTDPHAHLDRLIKGLDPVKMPTLVLGVQSDILFPVWQQREIADCLRKGGNGNVTYYELDSLYGHDTFLIDLPGVGGAMSGFINRV